MSKGQVSSEYMFLVGIFSLILLPILSISFTQLNEDMRVQLIQDAANELTSTAESIYVGGPGNERVIDISLPTGITNSTIIYDTVIFWTHYRGQPMEIYSTSSVPIQGNVSTRKGIYNMRITTYPGFVNISPLYLELS